MIKIGVIGVGRMGKNHVRVCSELDNVELIGIADINKEEVNKVAHKFSTHSFYDYRELIPKIECAIVATPTSTHHKIAMDLLNAGKSVLVEKPICNNAKMAEEMINFAEKENLTLAVGHIERYNPVIDFIKRGLDNKTFGKLITLSSKRVSDTPSRIKDAGVLLDLSVHDIDVMRYLAGEVESVYASAGKFNINIDFEDYANIILNFGSGICGMIEVNWLTPIKVRKIFLTCSRRFVEGDYINQSVTISSSKFGEIDEMNLYQIPIHYNINKINLRKREPLRIEIEDFINAVKTGKQPMVTGEDGLMAIKIVDAIEKSYKNKEVVNI